jgi:hypothetical protein
MGATPAQINASAAVGSAAESSDGSPASSALASAPSNGAAISAYSELKVPGKPAPNNSKTTPKTPEASFPPKYLTEVAWNAKSHSLQWKTGSARFATKEELIAFRKMLDEQQSAIKAKGAPSANQGGAN